jgi:hypothetical protein
VGGEAKPPSNSLAGTRVIRKYYYTSVPGGEEKVRETADWLKQRRFEAPRVFPRDKTRGSKRIAITLATDMLVHASRRHYELAVLVAGDAVTSLSLMRSSGRAHACISGFSPMVSVLTFLLRRITS